MLGNNLGNNKKKKVPDMTHTDTNTKGIYWQDRGLLKDQQVGEEPGRDSRLGPREAVRLRHSQELVPANVQ